MTLSRNFFALATAFCSMCLAALCLTIVLFSPSDTNSFGVAAAVASAVAGFILWWQADRDLDAVLALVTGFALPLALILGIYILSASDAGRAPRLAAGVAGAVGVVCLAVSYRRQRSESAEFPNILLRGVAADAIFETEGIQFTGFLTAGVERSPHAVTIVLQNCFDAPRRATILLDPGKLREYLRFQPTTTVALAGGEVVRVTLPIVTPTYPARYPLYLSVRVEGNGGHRVRLWRAQEATTRTSTAETAVLLAFGVVSIGGGIKFDVGPLPEDIWNEDLPAPEVQTIWRDSSR